MGLVRIVDLIFHPDVITPKGVSGFDEFDQLVPIDDTEWNYGFNAIEIGIGPALIEYVDHYDNHEYARQIDLVNMDNLPVIKKWRFVAGWATPHFRPRTGVKSFRSCSKFNIKITTAGAKANYEGSSLGAHRSLFSRWNKVSVFNKDARKHLYWITLEHEYEAPTTGHVLLFDKRDGTLRLARAESVMWPLDTNRWGTFARIDNIEDWEL